MAMVEPLFHQHSEPTGNAWCVCVTVPYDTKRAHSFRAFRALCLDGSTNINAPIRRGSNQPRDHGQSPFYPSPPSLSSDAYLVQQLQHSVTVTGSVRTDIIAQSKIRIAHIIKYLHALHKAVRIWELNSVTTYFGMSICAWCCKFVVP